MLTSVVLFVLSKFLLTSFVLRIDFQEPSAVMATRVANSSLPDTEFFPVVTTTLKLAHEEGDEGWSYRGRPDPDRYEDLI